MANGKLRKLPQVNGFWQTNGPPCGFSCELLASFNAFDGFLYIPNPSISLLQVGCLEEVVLLLGCSDLKHKLKIKIDPIRNDPFQGPLRHIAVDTNNVSVKERVRHCAKMGISTRGDSCSEGTAKNARRLQSQHMTQEGP